MIEATGAARHIYTPAAVEVRCEMTLETRATRHHDAAGGEIKNKKGNVHEKKLNNKQKTCSPGSLVHVLNTFHCFHFPLCHRPLLMLQSNVENANGHDSDLARSPLRSQSAAFLNIL